MPEQAKTTSKKRLRLPLSAEEAQTLNGLLRGLQTAEEALVAALAAQWRSLGAGVGRNGE